MAGVENRSDGQKLVLSRRSAPAAESRAEQSMCHILSLSFGTAFLGVLGINSCTTTFFKQKNTTSVPASLHKQGKMFPGDIVHKTHLLAYLAVTFFYLC